MSNSFQPITLLGQSSTGNAIGGNPNSHLKRRTVDPLGSQPLMKEASGGCGNVRIHNDSDNKAHGANGHVDMVTSIPGGVDNARVDLNGNVIGGTTRVANDNFDWY